jgi:hypothetical protein
MKTKIQQSYPTIDKLGGKTRQIRRLVNPEDKTWSAFNPSIAYSPAEGYAVTIRSSNYVIYLDTGYLEVTNQGEIKAQVWFAELNDDLSLRNLRQVQFDSDLKFDRGVEDAKLFWRDNSWWFTGVIMEKAHTPYARVGLFKYNHKTNTATLIKKHDGPDYARPEKNWMAPYEFNPNFDYVYGPTALVKDNVLIQKFNTNKSLSGLRGNTNLWDLGDGTYIAVVHTLYTKNVTYQSRRTFSMHSGTQKFYTHRFAKYDSNGYIIGISKEFQFEINGIEFAAGIVEKDGDFLISYGINDISAHIASIPKNKVLALVEDI